MTTKPRKIRKPIARRMMQSEKDAWLALGFCYVTVASAIVGAAFAAIQ
jgi:hypothetical protein